MKNEPGYPLPDGELGEDEIVCQLVYLPDRPEYWQAFLGALHYMTTWRAWERDVDKRGKDAAANWREAFELTIGCWRMTCLEQLQDDVAAILAIMQIPPACCEAGDVTDGDQYTDRVEDGVGDVPQNIIDAGYASDSADWDGFDDYKCMISHVIVDQLNLKLLEIAPLVEAAGGILGGVAAIAGILAVIFGTGGLAIVFGIVAGIGATSLLYQAITDFGVVDSLAAKVVTNHDDLVCAVYTSDGDVDALSALNDEIDELFTAPEALVLKNMNLGPTLKALYAGRYDQQDIAEILFDAGYELGDFTCTCDDYDGEYQLVTDFETEGFEGWSNAGGAVVEMGRGGGWCYRGSFNETNNISLSVGELLNAASLPVRAGTKIQIHSVRYWYYFGGSNGQYIKLMMTHDGGTDNSNAYYSGTWAENIKLFDPPLESTYNLQLVVKIRTIGSLYLWYLDDVIIDFDYEY